MRKFGPRVAAASATLLSLIGVTAGTASGDRIVETVYTPTVYTPTVYAAPAVYTPTAYVTTSNVVGETYYVPTGYSYVAPASYATTAYTTLPTEVYATSYTAPVAYEAVTYRRAGLFRRRYAQPYIATSRTYAYDAVPTVSYQPTTLSLDAPVVATGYAYATACNETSAPFNPPAPVDNRVTPTGSITSTPKQPQDPNYYAPPEKPKASPPEAGAGAGTGAASGGVGATGAATKSGAAATKGAAADDKLVDPVPPVAPDNGVMDPGGSLNPPPEQPKDMPKDATSSRSFRPSATVLTAREGSASASSVLRGEVLSGLTGKPEAKLQVVFTDLKGNYPDRVKTTDDKGAFEVFLPNGGWSIRVVDPTGLGGGKPKEYGQVTATNGRYLDEQDSPIYSLRLNH